MKKPLALFLTLVMCLTVLTAVSAAPSDVFVSPDGSDSADGSVSAPFKTLKKAVDVADSGATVYLREGTYNEGAVVNKSLKIKAYNNEKVVFAASQVATPQEATDEEKNIIWAADSKTKIMVLSDIERVGEVRAEGVSHALLCDGEFEYPASLFDDNVICFRRAPYEKVESLSSIGYEALVYIEKKELADNVAEYTLNMSSKELLFMYDLSAYANELSQIDFNAVGFVDGEWFSSSVVFGSKNEYMKITAADIDKKQNYNINFWFLYNPAFINRTGEWGSEGNKIFYRMPSAAKTIEYLADYTTFIEGKNARAVEISGIEFSKTLGNAVYLKDCPGSVVENCSFINIADDAVVLENSDNSCISNCTFSKNASGCVVVSSDGCVVDNCGIENSGVIYKAEPAVELIGDNNVVSSSEFSHCSAEAVYINGKNNTVTKCRVSEAGEFTAECVINISEESAENEIKYNIINDSHRNSYVEEVPIHGSDVATPSFFGWWEHSSFYNSDEDGYKEDYRKGISTNPISGVGVNGTDNIVSNNIFSNISYGVELNLSTGTTVSGNVFATDYTYINPFGIHNEEMRERDYPQKCVIKDNFICDQNEINFVDLKRFGSEIAGNEKVSRQIILNRDDSLVFDVAQQKIPDFKNIDSESIGRYEPAEESEIQPQADNRVVLLIGSEKVSTGGVVSALDASARIVNDRTLVPVRFISEAFGKTVSWDGQTRTVTIDGEIKITIGKPSIIKNGTEQVLDTPANIYDSRTFVPLRAIAEALEKQVLWDNRGLIVISDSDISLQESEIIGYISKLS